LGGVLYVMLVKVEPSCDVDMRQRREGEFCKKFRWARLSASCRDLLGALLSKRPAGRPTCAQAHDHWEEAGGKGGRCSCFSICFPFYLISGYLIECLSAIDDQFQLLKVLFKV